MGKPLERNIGLAAQLINFLIKHNIGVIQLTCPEFTFCGNPRPPRTKNDYESLSGFKEHCNNLARAAAKQLKALSTMSEKPYLQILAVVGVKRSPSCAIRSAPRRINGKTEYVEERGIFMEFLENKMVKTGLNLPFIEFDFEEPGEITEILEGLIRKD